MSEKNTAEKAWPGYHPVWAKKPNESWRDGMNALFEDTWKESLGDIYDDGEGGTFILATSTGNMNIADIIIRVAPTGKQEIRQALGKSKYPSLIDVARS